MKIIEKKKINERIFINSKSNIDKFFTKIDIASDYLEDIDDTDEYLKEYARIFGAYVAMSLNTLRDDGFEYSVDGMKLSDAFRRGYMEYIK